MGHRTGLYSDEHGNLKLTVGKEHRTFDVKWNGEKYEVEIDGSRFTGRYLSNLTEDVNRLMHNHWTTAQPRPTHSLVDRVDERPCQPHPRDVSPFGLRNTMPQQGDDSRWDFFMCIG
uniref:Non-specific protein-tyrosine kinase n=1 Tax=Mesocestoides corti TaxID=53468 RepID=A0A5K3F1X6_MESCO